MNMNKRTNNSLLRRALKVAKESYSQDVLKHVILTTQILDIVGAPAETIAAGYLHEILEKTPMLFTDLEDEFGENVANLVVESTATNPNTYPMLTSGQAVLIRFASRLANLSHLQDMDHEKQLELIKQSKFWHGLPGTH